MHNNIFNKIHIKYFTFKFIIWNKIYTYFWFNNYNINLKNKKIENIIILMYKFIDIRTIVIITSSFDPLYSSSTNMFGTVILASFYRNVSFGTIIWIPYYHNIISKLQNWFHINILLYHIWKIVTYSFNDLFNKFYFD